MTRLGYTETFIENGKEVVKDYGFLSVIKRKHNVFHRIDKIDGETITLFLTFGNYGWKAFNVNNEKDTNGVFLRFVWLFSNAIGPSESA